MRDASSLVASLELAVRAPATINQSHGWINNNYSVKQARGNKSKLTSKLRNALAFCISPHSRNISAPRNGAKKASFDSFFLHSSGRESLVYFTSILSFFSFFFKEIFDLIVFVVPFFLLPSLSPTSLSLSLSIYLSFSSIISFFFFFLLFFWRHEFIFGRPRIFALISSLLFPFLAADAMWANFLCLLPYQFQNRLHISLSLSFSLFLSSSCLFGFSSFIFTIIRCWCFPVFSKESSLVLEDCYWRLCSYLIDSSSKLAPGGGIKRKRWGGSKWKHGRNCSTQSGSGVRVFVLLSKRSAGFESQGMGPYLENWSVDVISATLLLSFINIMTGARSSNKRTDILTWITARRSGDWFQRCVKTSPRFSWQSRRCFITPRRLISPLHTSGPSSSWLHAISPWRTNIQAYFALFKPGGNCSKILCRLTFH